MRISDWSSDVCSSDLGAVQPLHVGAWIEALGGEMSAHSVKQQLAGVRRVFDWLLIGQVMPVNPAASVRVPANSQRRGKQPVLAHDEARRMLVKIDGGRPARLRVTGSAPRGDSECA